MIMMGVAALFMMLCVLIGFSTGRRLGYRSGVDDGRALTKIELREESLRKGVCQICDRP